ncbi:MAG: metallophosphoesterase [Lachnospiraceae bacterium]|nr:metallophosphoesterase [Lachnospiraceae bacterium]
MGPLAWIVLIVSVAAIGFFLRSQYERDQLVTTEYTISVDDLSPEFDGMRIVYLTDLHDKEFGPENQRLIEEIRAVKPDMVLVGGDTPVVRNHKPSSVRQTVLLMKKLSKEYPVYYGYGNHELRLKTGDIHEETYQELICGLREADVRVLDDCSVTLHGSRGSLTVTGLTMPRAAYPKCHKEPLEGNMIERKVGVIPAGDTRILMAHTPLYREEYAAWGAEVTLCGHYHGGTINLPLLGGVMSPDYHLFPGICRGRYETEGKTMIVSGGLGTHSINIRFGNKPEIVLLKLICRKEANK